MLNKSDGKIGIREYTNIVILVIGNKLSDIAPTLLLRTGMNASWIIPVISGVIVLILFMLILPILKKYKDKGLIEIIYLLFGEKIGFLLSFLLFLISLCLAIVNSRMAVDTANTMFFPKTPTLITYIIFISGSYYVAHKGFEAIGHTCWIMVPILIVAASLIIFLVIPDMRFNNIFPLGGSGVPKIMMGSIKYSSMMGEVIILSIFFPYVRNYNDYKIGSLLALAIGVVLISVTLVTYILVFDIMSLQLITYPFHELTRIIRIGRFISNAEGLFFQFWIIAAILRNGIYIYMATGAFGYMIKLKEFEYLVLPMTILIVILGMMPSNIIETLFGITNNLFIISSVIIIFLTILLWIVFRLKGSKS